VDATPITEPYRGAGWIPADTAYVLRPGRGTRLAMLGGSLAPAAASLMFGGAAVLGGGRSQLPALGVTAAIAVVAAAIGLPWWRWICRPVLAADEHVVWLYSRRMPPRFVRLPWSAVDDITYMNPHRRAVGIRVTPVAGSGVGPIGVFLPSGTHLVTVVDALNALRAGPDAAQRQYRRVARPPRGLPLSLRAKQQPALRRWALVMPPVFLVAVGGAALGSLAEPAALRLPTIGVVAAAVLGVAVPWLVRAAYHGPVLAADRDGAWIAYRPGRHAVFLPWPDIAAITITTRDTTTTLRVEPRHPWPLRPSIAMAPRGEMRMVHLFRTGLTVTADTPTTDLVGTLRALSGERVPLTTAG
jgi:hypothetical protein